MKRWLAIFAVVCLGLPAWGQGGSQASSVLRSSAGAAGATVRVCVSTASGTPCSPLANIFTDAALTVPKSNPFAADAVGNYGYYASPRIYKEQVTVGGATFTQVVTVPEDGGFPLSGVIITRTSDGDNAGERLADCLASLPATGGTCDARSDVLTPIWNIDPFAGITKPVRVLLGAATIAVNVDVTVPVNITIEPYRGALFKVASGKTLRINGATLADRYQRIVDLSGGGTVFFSGGTAYPGWYGATANARATTHAEATASNATLVNTLDSPWVAEDVGKTIVLYSSTYSPGLKTTISAFTDTAHIVLASAPTSTTSVNAVWGTDDTAAIQAAMNSIPATTPNSAQNTLYFPAGIYMMSSPVVYSNASGLRVLGDGPASPSSLGNYNIVNGQPGGGTSLVWIGNVGGALGCTSASGVPPSGVDNALTNCTAAENYMMKLSGQFTLENINLQGSQRASHLLEVGGGDTSVSFGFVLRNVFGGYARQYGIVLGGTNADQPGNFGEALLENIELAYNGLPNSALLENDPTCGGNVFVRYNNGNFQKQWDTGFLGSSNDVDGCHHIFWYNGNFAILTNIYFAPKTGNGTSHSSLYYASTAGDHHTFDNLYDENGYFIHVAGGNHFDMRQVQLRKQPTTNPHFGGVFDTSVSVSMDGVNTAGLPIVFKAGGTLNHQGVDIGSTGLGAAALYKVDNCSTGGCITRSGSDVTMPAPGCTYVVNDWVQINAVADATYNGVFKVTSACSGGVYHVTNAAAVGASTTGGTSAIGCCIIAETATGFTPQDTSPFINYNALWNGFSASAADTFTAIVTNLAAKNAIVTVSAAFPGASGSSLPATIPAGWNFLDMRGGTPTFLGGPYAFGTVANPVTFGVEGITTFHKTGASNRTLALNSDSGSAVNISFTNNGSETFVVGASNGATKTFTIGSSTKTFFQFDDTNNTLQLGSGTGPTTINLQGPTKLVGGAISPSAAGGQTAGTGPLPFSSVYIGAAATNNVQLTATATSAKVATLPDNTGTIGELNLAQTWTATQTFSAAPVPSSAGGIDLGTGPLPWGHLYLGTAATNNYILTPAATAAARTVTINDPLANSTWRTEISGTQVLDIGSVVTATCSGNTGVSGDSSDVTVTGAAVGDSVLVTSAAALPAGTFLIGRVTATNTGRFQLCNLSGSNVDRASDTYTVRVFK